MRHKLNIAALATLALMAVHSPAQSSALPLSPLCDLQSSVAAGQQRTVRVEGVYLSGLEHQNLMSLTCSKQSTAVEFQLKDHRLAWVQGQSKAYSIERLIRGIKIGALHRENRIWLETEPDPFIDPAIELLAPLQSGATNKAIAGGWAAIESLLAEPKSAKADPAERLATIVACSFPRAELTFLAYSLGKQHPPYKELLAPHVENRDKATFVAKSILDGTCPEPSDWSDKAAVQRMHEILTDPQRTLATIRNHVNDSFDRLYRQRNLILHAGRTRAVALRSTLRGATPLVGAGLDRICHARFVDGVEPIRFAGRARTAIATVAANDPAGCIGLLGRS